LSLQRERQVLQIKAAAAVLVALEQLPDFP
jgi:hypothetical protein